MKTDFLYVLAAAFLITGCGGRRQEAAVPVPFPKPSVPSMINTREEALDFLSLHYWDEFTDPDRKMVSDSVLVSGVLKEDVEQAFSDYLGILGIAGPDLADKAMSGLFEKIAACEQKDTSSNVFETVTALADRYLYDPNSPMRNEDIYLPFVSRLAVYEGIPASRREGYGFDAAMCALNRTGTQASDFRFSDRYGKIRTLYGIDAEYTLLFFSNPGCVACKEVMDRIVSDPVLDGIVSSGRLAVVNIYIDEDIKEWYSYMPVYPEAWYNGYDPDFVIRDSLLYNVRAIPSLYLLGRDKTVIMKDAPENKVFSYLHGI